MQIKNLITRHRPFVSYLVQYFRRYSCYPNCTGKGGWTSWWVGTSFSCRRNLYPLVCGWYYIVHGTWVSLSRKHEVWYVSNVSIIFDVPCLFYTICLVFCYTSWHFYAFFRTNLLTRCHSASSLFSAIFVFQKSYIGNILGIGRNQSQTSRYFTELPEHRRGDV
jgi:hypothetical protein